MSYRELEKEVEISRLKHSILEKKLKKAKKEEELKRLDNEIIAAEKLLKEKIKG